MMALDNESRWQSLPPFLILLLLAVGSYWWMPWPLYGERPPQSYAGIPLEGVQQAEARLWQDPFAVAQRHREQKRASTRLLAGLDHPFEEYHAGAEHRDLNWLGNLVAKKCSEGQPCRVLGVMVFGGPYMGMEEYRRYTRYAVLAGLSRHGYIPEDTEHVGYVEPGRGLPPVMPFEWLRGEGSEPLLLLWLDEDALTREYYYEDCGNLESEILPRLAELFSPLNDDKIRNPKVIIGPASSGTLSRLAGEWKQAEKTGWTFIQDAETLRKIHWYSSSATSDKAWARVAAQESKPLIRRVIARDSDLVDQLIEELIQRGLEPSDTVALVGQLDTEYSRNLIELLNKGLDDSFSRGHLQVVTAHYLRGLDGEKPGAKDGGNNNGNDGNKGNGAVRRDAVERPQGDSQIDYLRRLTAELARQHQAFKPSGEIAAVGILGDDYHDKLLVLKALRHAFPDAVFFTTDLEAAMLHPVDNRHTRNLVVASAFGLELEPALQAGFAPFRSSYQTASYLATRVAMVSASSAPDRQAVSQEEIEPSQEKIDKRISPLLFEIGRSAPVRLNNPAALEAAEDRGCGPQRVDWLECADWQPTRENRPTGTTILGSALALVGGVWLAAVLSGRFWRFLLGHWRILAAAVASTAAFAAWLIASLPSPLGEPFSWVEGVSVWPTEILRALTVAISILLFLSGIRRLHRCDESIHERFFLGAEGKGPRKDDKRHSPAAAPGEHDVPVTGIWRLYRARQFCVDDLTRRLADKQIEVVPSRLKRHFVLQNIKPAMIYLVLGSGLVLALGRPQTPARGEAMFVLDQIVLFAAVVSFLMLLFFTLNASRRAVWLVDNLSKRSSWPHTALTGFASREVRDQKYFDDFLDIQLLAEATSGVQRLVYYPFAVFFLLVLSRTSLFDGWHIPVSLYLIFAVAGILMLATAVRLRRAAEKSRSRALKRMNLHLLEIQGKPDMEAMKQQMQSMIDLTRDIRQGAYRPFGEQPIVRAILGLASGIYAIFFLEWMNMNGL